MQVQPKQVRQKAMIAQPVGRAVYHDNLKIHARVLATETSSSFNRD
jgi:hypothetical protein